PEKCLVRFIDLNVEPDTVYEYRIRIKMANPLYHKKDRAVEVRLTETKELVSAWAVVDKKVSLPAQLFYYAVDEKPGDNKRVERANQDRAAMQIHKWLERIENPNNKKTEINVGDWCIAERLLVNRGEYVGKIDKVEVPAFDPTMESFVLVVQEELKRKRIP